MRVEIDKETLKILDQIRAKNWHIGGKGHSDTVRFLAKFYLQHGSLEKLLDQRLSTIQELIQQGFRAAIRDAILNLLEPRHDDKPPISTA